VNTINNDSRIVKLKLECDYIERQIYMKLAAPEDYERLKKITKLIKKLTK
jgi:hypothetical protein